MLLLYKILNIDFNVFLELTFIKYSPIKKCRDIDKPKDNYIVLIF